MIILPYKKTICFSPKGYVRKSGSPNDKWLSVKYFAYVMGGRLGMGESNLCRSVCKLVLTPIAHPHRHCQYIVFLQRSRIAHLKAQSGVTSFYCYIAYHSRRTHVGCFLFHESVLGLWMQKMIPWSRMVEACSESRMIYACIDWSLMLFAVSIYVCVCVYYIYIIYIYILYKC